MSEYCIPRDVRLALTPDADEADKATAASLSDAQINDAIREASGIVFTRLSRRYGITTEEIEVPTDNATLVYTVAVEPVRSYTRNIAAYLSALTFRKNKDLPEDDPIRLRFNMTMDTLEKVRSGDIDLDLPGVGGVSGDDVVVLNQYEGNMFTMDDVGLGYEGKRIQRFEIMGGNY